MCGLEIKSKIALEGHISPCRIYKGEKSKEARLIELTSSKSEITKFMVSESQQSQTLGELKLLDLKPQSKPEEQSS